MVGTTTFRVGNQNVQNMFAKADITDPKRQKPKSEESKAALAEVLRLGGADVWSLQELSSENTLKDFMKKQELAKEYPYVAHVPGNSNRGINVGVISKFPITKVVSHKDTKFDLADGSGTTKFSRDFLRVDIDVDKDNIADVSVYNTHSKSRIPARGNEIDSDLQRLSEARAMRNIAISEMKEFPNRTWVITGDLNDSSDDKSVQALLNPAKGEKTEVLRDSLDHLPLQDRNTWPSNPNNKRYAPEQFDHIVYPQSQASELVGSEIRSYDQIGDFRSLSSTASDHKSVIADFNITPSSQNKPAK